MIVTNHLASENHWLAFLMDCGVKDPIYDDSNGYAHENYRKEIVKNNFPRNQDIANADHLPFFVKKLEDRIKLEETKRDDLLETLKRLDANRDSLLQAADTLKLMHHQTRIDSAHQARTQAQPGKANPEHQPIGETCRDHFDRPPIVIPQLIGRGKREVNPRRETELEELRKYFHPDVWPAARKLYEEQFNRLDADA